MSAARAEARARPAEGLTEGTRLADRFRLGRLLGKGGMGAVYAAEDEHIGRDVALKVLTVSGNAALARFRAEARAASRVSSRHVAAVHDFGTDERLGVSYIVLEMLDGHTLEEVIAKEGRLDPSTAAAIGAEIAEALGAAHGARVVHRDLKPSNVWLLRDGGAKVIDFGIARVLSTAAEAKMTAPDKIMGTPRYISPEAVDGHEVGPPADLYALGVMLFEMVAGEPPFDDEHAVILCGKHLTEPPPLLAQVCPDVVLPAAYQDLVSALLEKDPRVRPPSALEVAEQLRGMTDIEGAVRLSGVAVTPAAVTSEVSRRPPPMPNRPNRLPRLIGLGLGLIGLLTGAAIITWSLPTQDTTTPSPQPSPQPEPSPDPGLATDPAPSPAPEAAPQPDDFTVTVQTRPARATLRLDGEVVTSPFDVSPDGAEHTVEAQAPGHAPRSARFIADQDHTLRLRLPALREGPSVPSLRDDW